MMDIMGIRHHARSSVATVLAGVATVLSAVAGLTESIAQELRLTLPEEESGAPDTGRGAFHGSPDRWGAEDAGPASDREEADRSAPGATGSTGGPGDDVAPVTDVTEAPANGGVRVRVLDDAEIDALEAAGGMAPGAAPPASGAAPTPAPDPVAASAPSERAPAPEPVSVQADPGPTPWADDVAGSIAAGTVREAVIRLPELTDNQLRALERHELEHRGRVTLLRAVDAELNSRL